MEAILDCDELSYKFPSTEEEVNDAAKEFKKLSSNNMMKGCVACMDGFLLRIQTPSSSETGHVKSFFLSHYQMYGVNIQAACDHKC